MATQPHPAAQLLTLEVGEEVLGDVFDGAKDVLRLVAPQLERGRERCVRACPW